MKPWVTLGAFLAILLLTGSGLAARCQEPTNAPQYHAGDKFAWKYVSGEEKRWEVVGVEQSGAHIRWVDQKLKEAGTYFIDANWIIQAGVNRQGEAVRFPGVGGFSSLGKTTLDFPLAEGKAWGFAYPGASQRGGTNFYRLDRKVLGCEEVTTPAGTFSSVKIESTQRNATGGSGSAWGMTYLWYSPDGKNIVKEAFGASNPADYWVRPVGSELIKLELK